VVSPSGVNCALGRGREVSQRPNMAKTDPFKGVHSNPEIIRLVVILRGKRGRVTVLSETGSHSPDITLEFTSLPSRVDLVVQGR
jgi:hypothetical protein